MDFDEVQCINIRGASRARYGEDAVPEKLDEGWRNNDMHNMAHTVRDHIHVFGPTCSSDPT